MTSLITTDAHGKLEWTPLHDILGLAVKGARGLPIKAIFQ